MSEAGPGSTTFAVRPDGAGAGLVVVRGEIDLANCGDFQAAVDQALEAGPTRLAFDLAEVRFMDSSGLAVLVAAANALPVEVRRASQIVRRLIEVSGLAEVLPIRS